MTDSELEARELLRLVLPFMDAGHDCLVCGAPTTRPHEKDCFVQRIEKLVDRKLWQEDERTAKCEHRAGGSCKYDRGQLARTK